MNKLSALITELCPNGVEYVPLWSVTIWDKRFNSVDRIKQPTAITYPYLLAADLFAMQQENGDVFLEYSARDCAARPLKLSIHSGGIEHACRRR